ncbi:DUF1028 domain-containing protein [Vibrio sp. TBV020]|uniref:DUF1028 domain-containing protein n=1 Tax=Vibrio sp. TBV020 TaxID=3137398 RepID=UPI0038CD4BBA
MTISLIHVNPKTGLSASITATGGVAVGGYVNHSWRNLGGCATQGLYTNPWYAEQARKCLSQGMSARETIEHLKMGDPEFSKRQCMVMDRLGSSAFIHGEDNIAVVGSIALPTVAVAGNMLESQSVLDAFCNSFLEQTVLNFASVKTGAEPEYRQDYESQLPETLIAALAAALRAGGDKRGTFSASLRIESLTHAPIDIRVDWADGDLIDALTKVLSHVREASFQEFLSHLPNK